MELRTATNDFSPSNKIGEGGFGCVYKGKLRNGRMAAIKVLSSWSRQGVSEFLMEIEVISDIEHANLVKLYGCCVDGSERILVYNDLENNSLAETLLGGGRGSIRFSWRTRVKLCIGVAKGIACLHEERLFGTRVCHQRPAEKNQTRIATPGVADLSNFGEGIFWHGNFMRETST